jgi:membrane-associated phospholipid phosphatase
VGIAFCLQCADRDRLDAQESSLSPTDDTVGTTGGLASKARSTIEAATTTETGPLGPVDPVTPPTPGTVVRPARATATAMVVVGLVGLIASLVVLGSIAEGVRAQEVFALDTWATPFLHGIASPGLDWVMLRLTDLGSSLVIVPCFAVVLALLLRARRYGGALFLTVASGGALILNASMKLFFQRPRPQLDYAKVLPDYSFPSGHTMNATVFYIALALILWSVFGRRVGLVGLATGVAISLGVGVSRIYLGYHYLTDVAGGLVAGVAWLLVVGAAFHARPTWWRWGSTDPRGAGRPDGPRRAAPG